MVYVCYLQSLAAHYCVLKCTCIVWIIAIQYFDLEVLSKGLCPILKTVHSEVKKDMANGNGNDTRLWQYLFKKTNKTENQGKCLGWTSYFLVCSITYGVFIPCLLVNLTLLLMDGLSWHMWQGDQNEFDLDH